MNILYLFQDRSVSVRSLTGFKMYRNSGIVYAGYRFVQDFILESIPRKNGSIFRLKPKLITILSLFQQ